MLNVVVLESSISTIVMFPMEDGITAVTEIPPSHTGLAALGQAAQALRRWSILTTLWNRGRPCRRKAHSSLAAKWLRAVNDTPWRPRSLVTVTVMPVTGRCPYNFLSPCPAASLISAVIIPILCYSAPYTRSVWIDPIRSRDRPG